MYIKMKRSFSVSWKASKQPRKQRKYIANAPLHLKKKFISVNLSRELRKKYGKRNVPVKKGDKVKVMKGKFRGRTGKVTVVELKNSKVRIEGIQVKKQDGSKVDVKLQPSNLQIIELNLEDRKRNGVFGKEKMKKTDEKKPESESQKTGEKESNTNKKNKEINK